MKLTDDYTVFYDPYKKPVSFKSPNGKSKVISKKICHIIRID